MHLFIDIVGRLKRAILVDCDCAVLAPIDEIGVYFLTIGGRDTLKKKIVVVN